MYNINNNDNSKNVIINNEKFGFLKETLTKIPNLE